MNMMMNQWRRWVRRIGHGRPTTKTAVLRVEGLEGRDVPSSTMYGGTINSSSQTYNHPNALGTALSGQTVGFEAIAFQVSTDDVYTLTNTSNTFSTGDGFFSLYQISFSPGSPLNNLLTVNDNGGGTLGLRPQIQQELLPGTTYVLVTSGATNVTGDFINQISSPGTSTYTFNTHSLPAVDNPTSATITGTGATLGATVEGDTGAAVTARGIVYSVNSVNGMPIINGTGVTNVTAGSGLGTFTANVTGLTPGTMYAFRAYATNSIGTFYTSPVSTFTADSPPMIGAVISATQNVTDHTTIQPFIPVTITDADTPPQTLTASVTYTAANGTFTTLGGFTGSAGTYTMTGTAAAIQAAVRGLTFVPTAHQVSVGSSVGTSFTITVNDGYLTATDSQTNVSALATDDPPTVANPIPPQTFSGAGVKTFTFAANTFADVDYGYQLTYTASLAAGGGLPSWLSFDSASRTFSGNPGANSTSPITLRVTANDGKGGTAHTDFSLTLTNVNDAPVLTAGNPTLPGILSTVGSAANSGQLVNTLIGSRITDADPSDQLGIAVASMTSGGGGTWQYATDGTTWTNLPAGTSAATPLLLSADADTRIRFAPSTNATSTPTITYQAWDGTAGGVEGSLSSVNPNGGGGTSAFSTVSETASITVTNGQPVGIAGIQINDGSAQRSMVRSLTVTFSGPVTFSTSAAAAFQLTKVGGGNVTLGAATSTDAQGDTVVTLSFSGSQTDQASQLNGGVPSLADGRYTLTVFGGQVTGTVNGLGLDGAGTGTAGSNYVSPTESAGGTGLHLYRLFGDATGDGMLDLSDLAAFRSTYNAATGQSGYLAYMDYDNTGAIDLVDLAAFRQRYNTSVF
jgi:hypothetical protein